MAQVEAVLLGAGGRGTYTCGAYAKRNPEALKFIAVAEVNEGRRKRFAQLHDIPAENCFASYEELLERPQMAPLCFNATMDRNHLPSALMALEKGYHLFLEKPMAHTPLGCLQIAQEAARRKKMVQICHPLRYTPFYNKLKEVLDAGKIGSIISMSMYENVGYWHFAHSFVRGNWPRMDTSGPLILTKCCHDMDLATWLADSQVKTVASMGNLYYFRRENAPPDAPDRCTDGCPVEKTCPFHAPTFYLVENGEDWPYSAISLDHSKEARLKALENGPYGRCIFKCDNDVVDHQVLSAEFENRITLNFAVRANSFYCYRTVRIIGTEGEINGHLEKSEFSVHRFTQGQGLNVEPEIFKVENVSDSHLGGDTGVTGNFLRAYRENDYAGMQHSLEIAVEGHLLSFAAEEARAKAQTVRMEDYKKTCR